MAHLMGPAAKSVLVALAAGALLLTPSAGAAPKAEHQALAGPGGFTYGYLTSKITISKGDSITLSNFDVFEHDFVQDVETDGFGGKKKKAPWCKKDHGAHSGHGDACPVFWSELASTGESVQIQGLKRVKPGKIYTFFCTIHHNMKGTLTVRN
ncbi:MAG: cupredoxin domain-containing protein [Actinomycetota bacterium]